MAMETYVSIIKCKQITNLNIKVNAPTKRQLTEWIQKQDP